MRNVPEAISFLKSISGVKLWRSKLTNEITTVEGHTDVGTYGITRTGVEMSTVDAEVTLAHSEVDQLLRGGVVQGFRKDTKECFGTTEVFTSKTAELHLDTEVYGAARLLFN